MSRERVFVILDTMIYLHYQPADQLNLPDLLGVDKVTVLVPRITLRELDEHKDSHQNSKIRDRAKNRLASIRRWLEENNGQISEKVEICFHAVLPRIDFIDHCLNQGWGDNQLLATIIQFKEDHQGERIILVTQDTGLLLTAQHIGIDTLMIPDDKKLPQEEDPLVKENRQLSNEVLRLKSLCPRLVLRFSDFDDSVIHSEFELEAPCAEKSFDKKDLLNRLNNDYPEEHPSSIPRNTLYAVLEQITDGEYTRYNRDRELYFKKMLQYIDLIGEYNILRKRTLPLRLELRNIGTVPGKDIDLHIHFPDGFELFTEDDFPEEPVEPSPPVKPRSTGEITKDFLVSGPMIPSLNNIMPHFGPPDPFDLKKTNSYDLTDHYTDLKHGYIREIKQLFVVFPSYDDAKSFSFEYVITAANLPSQERGTLNIVVNKK